jgi:hypothetical protein
MKSLLRIGKSFSSSSFAKYDYTDALNLKSLLTEEEVMV